MDKIKNINSHLTMLFHTLRHFNCGLVFMNTPLDFPFFSDHQKVISKISFLRMRSPLYPFCTLLAEVFFRDVH